MNVKEAFDFLKAAVEKGMGGHELEIETSEIHLSGGGIVPLKSMSVGFDWYHGKILLAPEKDLIPKELGRDVPQKPWDYAEAAGLTPKGRMVCPQCETMVNGKWRYCPKCGQRLDWGKA
ncbi:MAG: zinc ribbon domain-containing protein [Clostridia bacterium]|nr:zinc ribbon domain-containing protein [Clostridia bacterium]